MKLVVVLDILVVVIQTSAAVEELVQMVRVSESSEMAQDVLQVLGAGLLYLYEVEAQVVDSVAHYKSPGA